MDLASRGKLQIYMESYDNKINEYNFIQVFIFHAKQDLFHTISVRNEIYYTVGFVTFYVKQESHSTLSL